MGVKSKLELETYDPYGEALIWGRNLLAQAKLKEPSCFITFCDMVKDVALHKYSRWRRDPENIKMAERFRILRDDYESIVAEDPIIAYSPQHGNAHAFHQSNALVRFYRGSNRSSKSMTCTADLVWTITGRHPYRPAPPQPISVAIVGKSYSKYCPTLFIPRFLTGEGGNPFSPLFPEDGRWFNRYDPLSHTIYLCCPACYQSRKAKSCKHGRSTITLFSDERKAEEAAGAQYAVFWIDEEVDVSFYNEGRQRIMTVPNSGMMVSLTPLQGEEFWTEKVLVPAHERGERVITLSGEVPSVDLFVIDQFSAGLTSGPLIIDNIRQTSDMGEVLARVFGLPAIPASDTVFNQEVLYNLQSQVRPPLKVKGLIAVGDNISNDEHKALTEFKATKIITQHDSTGNWHMWQPPKDREQYIIGCDVAQGLTGRDYSAAQVIRMWPENLSLNFEVVAQIHKWINPHEYAIELYKLGMYYNTATLAVERNGPGHETLRWLKNYNYPRLYVPAQVSFGAALDNDSEEKFGVTTSTASKPIIVSVLQNVVSSALNNRSRFVCPCGITIRELRSFIEDPNKTGTFHASGTKKDDLVMALGIGVYVATTGYIFDAVKYANDHQDHAETQTVEEFEHNKLWSSIHKQMYGKK